MSFSSVCIGQGLFNTAVNLQQLQLYVCELSWVTFIGQLWPLTSLTLGGRNKVRFLFSLMGSSPSQRAVWPYMAVPLEESAQADLSLSAIAVYMQIHLLVLDCAPQPFHQDVVVAAMTMTH